MIGCFALCMGSNLPEAVAIMPFGIIVMNAD